MYKVILTLRKRAQTVMVLSEARSITLNPGINEVSAGEYELLKKHHKFQNHLAARRIEVVGPAALEAEKEEPSSPVADKVEETIAEPVNAVNESSDEDLTEFSVRELAEALKSNEYSPETILIAIDAEKEGKNRKSIIELLEGALS